MRGFPAAIFDAAERDVAENSTSSEPVDVVEVLLPVLPVLPWLLIDSKVTFPAADLRSHNNRSYLLIGADKAVEQDASSGVRSDIEVLSIYLLNSS